MGLNSCSPAAAQAFGQALNTPAPSTQQSNISKPARTNVAANRSVSQARVLSGPIYVTDSATGSAYWGRWRAGMDAQGNQTSLSWTVNGDTCYFRVNGTNQWDAYDASNTWVFKATFNTPTNGTVWDGSSAGTFAAQFD